MEVGLDLHLKSFALKFEAFGRVLPTRDPALVRACLPIGGIQGLTHFPVLAPQVSELNKLVDQREPL